MPEKREDYIKKAWGKLAIFFDTYEIGIETYADIFDITPEQVIDIKAAILTTKTDHAASEAANVAAKAAAEKFRDNVAKDSFVWDGRDDKRTEADQDRIGHYIWMVLSEIRILTQAHSRPETNIKFSVKENEIAELVIYNIKGQTITSESYEAGTHTHSPGMRRRSIQEYISTNCRLTAIQKLPGCFC